MKKLFCSQPKLLIAIELKLAEILGVCGIVGIFYGFYLGLGYLSSFKMFIPIVASIMGGVLAALALLVLYGFGLGIYHAIKANWAWAGRLSKK